MKKNNKRKKNILLILILVVGISIGYAALASNLKINGTSKIAKATWNIHWENPVVTTGSVTMDKPSITGEDRQTAEFSVTLNEPGDFYEFRIDAVNTGTIPAVLDSIESKVNGEVIGKNTLPNRVNYKVTYGDGTEIDLENELLKVILTGGMRQVFKVRVEYSEDIEASDLDEKNDLKLNFQFKANYVQAPKTQSVEPKEDGDEVCFNSECFYVIDSDNETTTLLAKYNLLVGNVARNYSVTGTVDANDSKYGLQSVNAKGFIGDDVDAVGVVPFASQTNYYYGYWADSDGNLLSSYTQNGASFSGNPYPYIYDKTRTGDPSSSNYSIAYYVNNYVQKLQTAPYNLSSNIEGRVLSYEEADAILKSSDTKISSIIDKGQAFWIASSLEGSSVFCFDPLSPDSISSTSYFYNDMIGVSVVIEIPTSEIN